MDKLPTALRRNDLPRFLLLAIPAVTLAGYFVLPGWLSAGVLLLYIASLAAFVQPAVRARCASLLRLAPVRWMLLALAAPLLAVAIVSIGHGELSPRHFEGPGRLFVASTVLLAFAAQRIDFARVAWWAFPLSVAVSAAWVFHPGASAFYWDGRAATVFMDPIALSYQSVVFGFLCVVLMPGAGARWKQVVLALAAALALLVALRTHSRTGLAIVPVLTALLAWRAAREKHASMAAPLLVLSGLFVAAYVLVPGMHDRVAMVVHEVRDYLNGGNRDTSIGVRLSLFRSNFILFCERPLLGWGYTVQPEILSVPAIRELYTPMFGQYWALGGHNEYLQSMMRMGIVGLLSRLLLLLVPLVLFARAACAGEPDRRRNGFLGLCVVIGYITCGMTQEVLNLTSSSSLYALLVSIFAAGALPERSPGPQVARATTGAADARPCLP